MNNMNDGWYGALKDTIQLQTEPAGVGLRGQGEFHQTFHSDAVPQQMLEVSGTGVH